MKKFSGLFAALSALALAFSTLVFGFANPESSAAAANFDFSSCVQNKKSGSVMLLMDESGSIYGSAAKKGSDPKAYRVTASKIMLDKIQRVADVYSAQINVLVAGFGDNFVIRSAGASGWTAIEPNKPNKGLAELQANVENFRSASKDNNGIETDIYSAIDGAQRALASQSSCRLLVLFKDGNDFQYFNKGGNSPVNDESITSLLQSKKFKDAESLAEKEICREGGLADGLRSTNTFLLSVALGAESAASDFSKLRSLTEGNTSCGKLSGFGRLLTSSDPVALPRLFETVLDPNFQPSSRADDFTFNMSNALASISVLSTGQLGAFGKYTITPPKTCSGGKPIEFDSAATGDGTFGAGVDWSSEWYGNDVFKIVIDHTSETENACWVGKWVIQPNGTSGAKGKATSTIEFDANLEAVPSFAEKDFYLVPGGATKDFTVQLRKVSTGAQLNEKNLDPSLSLSVDSKLEDMQGNAVQDATGNYSGIKIADLASAKKLGIAKGTANGDYRLVLTLSATVDGLGVNLRPIRTEQTISVHSKNRVPVAKTPIDFGDINGKTPVVKEITFKQSPDAAFNLAIDNPSSRVAVSQFPLGMSYVLSPVDGQAKLEIPKGNGETKLKISFRANQDKNVTKSGLVSGQLQIMSVPSGSESDAEPIAIPFTANQKADANVGLQWLFILLFTLIGLGLTFGALQLVGWIVARFPSPLEAANLDIRGLQIRGNIVDGEFVPTDPNASANLSNFNAWQNVFIQNDRRSVIIGDMNFKAKSPGWRLGSSGFGIIDQAEVKGLSSEINGHDGLAGGYSAPKISLSLQRTWALVIQKSDLGLPQVPATALLVMGTSPASLASDFGAFDLQDSSEDRFRMLSEIQTAIRLQAQSGIKVDTHGEPKKARKSKKDDSEAIITFDQPNNSQVDPFA